MKKFLLLLATAFLVITNTCEARSFGQGYSVEYCTYLSKVAKNVLSTHYIAPGMTKHKFQIAGIETYANIPDQLEDYMEIVDSAFTKNELNGTHEQIIQQIEDFGEGAYQECVENQSEE